MKRNRESDAIARSLIGLAARHAPPTVSERLQEEWLADLAERRGTWARLRLALGCCWAAQIIHRELVGVGAAASTAGTEKVAIVAAPHDVAFFSRRTLILLLILGLHALLIYGFANGLAHTIAVAFSDPIVGSVIQTPHTPEALPPPPAPNFQRPRVDLPAPDLTLEPATDPAVIIRPADPPRVEPSRIVTPQVDRIVGGPGKGFPATDEYYPTASRRLGETGVATVRTCVDARGALTAEPTIAQSSGSARLDQGALKLAQAGSGHYRPTLEDGKPVSSCYAFRVRFALRD